MTRNQSLKEIALHQEASAEISAVGLAELRERCGHDWRRAMDEETKWTGEMCIWCGATQPYPEVRR